MSASTVKRGPFSGPGSRQTSTEFANARLEEILSDLYTDRASSRENSPRSTNPGSPGTPDERKRMILEERRAMGVKSRGEDIGARFGDRRPSPLVRRRPKSPSRPKEDPEALRIDRAILMIKDFCDRRCCRINDLVREVDLDQSGTIDEEELVQALAKLGSDISRSDVGLAFSFIDKDGNGEIEVKELDRAVKAAERRRSNGLNRSLSHDPISPRRTPGPDETCWGRLGPPPQGLLDGRKKGLDRTLSPSRAPEESKIEHHIVFCLDESGSMKGDAWSHLERAFANFVKMRISKKGKDLISIVQFAKEPRATMKMNTLEQASTFKLPYCGSNKTFFKPAVKYAQQLFLQAAQRRWLTPVLIFMSDGQNGDGDVTLDVKAIATRFPDLQCHTIFLGRGGSTRLQGMAKTVPGGVYHESSDGSQLEKTFADIAEKRLNTVVKRKEKVTYESIIGELRRLLLERFRTKKKAFRSLDTNNNGSISYSELAHGLDRLRIPWVAICENMSFREVFKSIDLNREGDICEDELFGDATDLEHMDFDMESSSASRSLSPPKERKRNLTRFMSEIREFQDPISIRQFADWASTENRWQRFPPLFYNEGHRVDTTVRPSSINQETFTRFCKSLGYKGDPELVFAEILRELRTGKDDLAKRKQFVSHVSLHQFEFFRHRCMGHVATLAAGEWGSPASAFVNTLRHRRGSALRGWRLDVDLRSNGRVAYMDFITAMRQLGMGSQAKQLWRTLRPDGSTIPLEFREVDPMEAALFDGLCEGISGVFGRNKEEIFHRAFEVMDPNSRKSVMFSDFCLGFRKLGFEGDQQCLRTLFRGLDVGGLNRIKKDDFLYLARLCPMKKVDKPLDPLLDDLKLWVQREVGGTEALLDKLTTGAGKEQLFDKDGAFDPTLFKHKLCSIGCTLDASTRLVDILRGADETARITPDAIREIVGGGLVPPTAKPRASSQNRTSAKPAWNDRCALELGLANRLNENVPATLRGYFSEAKQSRDLLHSPQIINDMGLSRALMRSHTSPGDLSEKKLRLTDSTYTPTSPGAPLSPSSTSRSPLSPLSPSFRAKEASASWSGAQSVRSPGAATSLPGKRSGGLGMLLAKSENPVTRLGHIDMGKLGNSARRSAPGESPRSPNAVADKKQPAITVVPPPPIAVSTGYGDDSEDDEEENEEEAF